jgi:hypothetical protein
MELQLVRNECIKFAILPYFYTYLSSTPLMPKLGAKTALESIFLQIVVSLCLFFYLKFHA